MTATYTPMRAPAAIDAARCAGCAQCRLVCPPAAITRTGAHFTVDPARCVQCGRCLRMCPVGCIAETPTA